MGDIEASRKQIAVTTAIPSPGLFSQFGQTTECRPVATSATTRIRSRAATFATAAETTVKTLLSPPACQ
mgnify:CR=1 FL=1